MDRINQMNCLPYDVPIPQAIRDVVVPREFLSSIYGGNPQVTFPSIGKEFLDKHGLNDFMYPSLAYNPAAAQIPGAPGLFFAVGAHAQEWPTVQRVITRIAPGEWLYMGQYTLTPSESLTLGELAKQKEKVSSLSFGLGVQILDNLLLVIVPQHVGSRDMCQVMGPKCHYTNSGKKTLWMFKANQSTVPGDYRLR
jgi:hypothetical protein